ncbi:WecB/TagA/CpsF family glycosyltransferase [Aestuariicoccus sp. MJ-SS9]|uniref:WecB/TagA/CpsF family glycosyltransferase n=1 Tax=Aestuariicoccus sp. MJ-SS9 TaxID=3079855 RepID=UPI0029142F79|nr:WecB/TagA/CpsF family glycosyltransferase [Aestuariicoccus sp. MJ-SS9]MDU8910820.1 WecB/TagA/CpsF family glycosyltransferase [Aestuariicoccus sp. MJ-SS9]
MEFVICGTTIRVNVATRAALEARVAERLAQRKGFALATLNLDHLVKLRSSGPFRRAYAAQDFVVADGNPIVWMSRLAGRPVELIPGSDAILPLARIAARQGVSVALVGSTDAALARAKSYLEREVRDLEVSLCIAPPMGFDVQSDAADAIFERLGASGAGLCFIALGAPKQEAFAAAGRQKAPAVGFASIGAGLDFFAGTQQRAPGWARRFALEWAWRMMTSPKRLAPRYARCVAILPGQMLRAALLRLRAERI